MTQENQNIEVQFLEGIKKNSGTVITMGFILLLIGLFAMGSPVVEGASIVLVVGVLQIVGGIGQLIFAFKADMGMFVIILGLLTAVMGGYMVSNPATALASLILAAYLIVSGVFEALAAFKARPVNVYGKT